MLWDVLFGTHLERMEVHSDNIDWNARLTT